jgi:hypothetical protein
MNATMKPVTSSNIAAIGHDGKAMIVQFKNGGMYMYDGVPADTFNEAMVAESIGRFLSQRIKPVFAAKRIP